MRTSVLQWSNCYGADSQEELVIPQCKLDFLSKLVWDPIVNVMEMTRALYNYIMAGWRGS